MEILINIIGCFWILVSILVPVIGCVILGRFFTLLGNAMQEKAQKLDDQEHRPFS